MPKIKPGKRYELNASTRGFHKGQLVEVISVSKRYGTCRARMPDGSVETLLLTMLIQHLGPPLFEIIAEQLRRLGNWLKNR